MAHLLTLGRFQGPHLLLILYIYHMYMECLGYNTLHHATKENKARGNHIFGPRRHGRHLGLPAQLTRSGPPELDADLDTRTPVSRGGA